MTPSDEMAQSRTEMRTAQNQSPASAMMAGLLRKKSSSGAVSPPPTATSPTANGAMFGGGSDTAEMKIAVLGFNGVGKTAFIVRFLTRRFIGEYCRGVEAKYKCSISVDGEIIHLQILDSSMPTLVGGSASGGGGSSSSKDMTSGPHTSSSNVYVRLNDGVVQWADAFILVYSITSHRSFQVIREIRKQITEQYGNLDKINNKPVMMLLGNKADLEHFREVDSKTAETYAEQKNDLVFYELSTANSPDDVQRCMYAFIRLARVRLLTSVAAASLVQHTTAQQQQQLLSQQQQQQQQPLQQQQQQQEQRSNRHNQAKQDKSDKSSGDCLAAPPSGGATLQSSSSSVGQDGSKQSAKAFLLNKMFGGMLDKKPKQQSVTNFQQPPNTTTRRSGDAGLVMTPSAPTFSD